ncbi:hypothetical protein BJ741DRAFT_617633 [Chytriomyces cf. hyalinus JEL632]|nr:hypothetical protein BJ741DRAFT_617633 [Chytriomyces cf. hyalinus JEL632]
MAGGHGPYILHDPAIEKWFHMQENTAKHFKLTKRTSKHVFWFLFAFPAFVYAGTAAKSFQMKHKDIRCARRE